MKAALQGVLVAHMARGLASAGRRTIARGCGTAIKEAAEQCSGGRRRRVVERPVSPLQIVTLGRYDMTYAVCA
jgi:hypothetical protein